MMLSSRSDNESIPLANRRETIWGSIIAFQILATIAVLLRAYVRAFVVKKIGWDDALIFLAWVTALVGNTFVCLLVNVGLGRHWDSLSFSEIKDYLFRFYIAYGMYSVSATLVKASLVFQYLRVLKDSRLRYVCIGLLILTALWGFTYSFISFFPCFPVEAYWDWSIADAKCYGYGAKKRHPFVDLFISHSAVNVVLDVAILVVPVPLLLQRVMTRREKWSVFGLASLGIVVILLCIWRLATMIIHQAGWAPTMDFSWRAPISIILGCLEAQTAIVAVSIPIFWSMLEERVLQIFVQNEIEITEITEPMELDIASAKSDAGSEEGLAPSKRWSPPRTLDAKEMFYREVIERISPSPMTFESSIETSGDGGRTKRIISR